MGIRLVVFRTCVRLSHIHSAARGCFVLAGVPVAGVVAGVAPASDAPRKDDVAVAIGTGVEDGCDAGDFRGGEHRPGLDLVGR